jgi:hypothetical protein
MTTIIHNVNRVTSAGSSKELAESHVKKLLGWQPRTPSNREDSEGAIEAPSRHPPSIPPET